MIRTPRPRPALPLLAALAPFAVAACGGEQDPAAAPAREGPPQVVTTFHPTAYLARRLVGELAEVHCDVLLDADALFWVPDDAALRRMQRADLVVLNGAGMEPWREQVSLPESRVVDSSAALEERFLEFGQAASHSHGGGEEHVHQGVDPHVWMDPLNALEQARAIHSGLLRALGEEHRAALDAALAGLEGDLQALHGELGALEVPEGQALYANHPAYDYLAARHGWPVVNLDLDPESVPTDEQLAEVRAALAERPGGLILWEAEPAPQARAALEALGLASVVYAPAELLPPGSPDFLAVQRANVARLRAALGG